MKKRISRQGTKFVDRNGCQVILHGINMVCKEKERNYIGDYTRQDFKMLKSWGFNVIRLGIFWDGVEPEPGVYDEQYLEKIDHLIQLAGEYGMVVYLDMHQDLFACQYSDGAPAWATLTDGLEHTRTELWSESYLLSPAVQHAFDQFWTDGKASDGVGIQEHFIRMWQHIARRYRENDTVIGYDFFNEPFPGTIANEFMGQLLAVLCQQFVGEESMDEEALMAMWLDPKKKIALLDHFKEKEQYEAIMKEIALVPQEFDRNTLNAFYQRIGEAVRAEDKTTLFFLEANYFSNAGVESGISPFKAKDGQEDYLQVYTPHGYDLLVDTKLYNQSNFERLQVIFDAHMRVQKRLGLPTLVGEWGCFPEAGPAEVEQARFLMRLFSKNLLSETYFDFSHIKNNSITEAIIRPYPMRTAGELLSYDYDDLSGIFECTIQEKKNAGDSVIYLPDLNTLNQLELIPFGEGYRIEHCSREMESSGEDSGYLIIKAIEDDVVRQICFEMQRKQM